MTRTFYKRINDELIDELFGLLTRGKHVALMGPAGAGKSLVVAEIRRRCGTTLEPVFVNIPHRPLYDETMCLNDICEQLGVSMPARSNDERLAGVIRKCLRSRIVQRKTCFIVNNVMVLPTHLARGVLEAIQELSESDRKISSIVTGSSDFIPLTYGELSPFRQAERYVVTSLDFETAASVIVKRRQGQVLRGALSCSGALVGQYITPDALEEVWSQTNGYLHFIQEALLTAMRNPELFPSFKSADPWDLPFIKNVFDGYLHEYMATDSVVQQVLRAAEDDVVSFDCLRNVLRDGDNLHSLPSPIPTSLEIMGVLRPGEQGHACIGAELWRQFLKVMITARYAADIYALHGQWDRAWQNYSQEPFAINASTSVDAASSRRPRVIAKWQNSFQSAEGGLVSDIESHVANGARHLFGFDRGGMFKRRGETWQSIPVTGEPLSRLEIGSCEALLRRAQQTRENPWISPSRLEAVTSCVEDRQHVIGEDTYLILARSSVDAVLYRGHVDELRNGLTAFLRADHRLREGQLDTRRRGHITAIQAMNLAFLRAKLDHSGTFVQTIVDLLVQHGGYSRVQLCLVNGEVNRVQAVASSAHGGMGIQFPTDMLLFDEEPEEEWDIQKWVVRKQVPASVIDASDPRQRSPRTQTAFCLKAGMRAITVVPLVDGGEVIGTLHFERHDRMPFVPEELELCEFLATHVALIINRWQQASLLVGAINAIPDDIRITNAKGNILFQNRFAADKDRCNQAGKGCHAGAPSIAFVELINSECSRKGSQGYYNDDLRACDWLFKPLDDFRKDLQPPFNQAESLVGFVTRDHDLTRLYQLLKTIPTWLTRGSAEDTADEIIAYFHQHSKWCRIYVLDRTLGDSSQLKSFRQFGLKDSEIIRKFELGEYVVNAADYQPSTGGIVAGENYVCVYRFNPTLRQGQREYVGRERGFPVFHINDEPIRSQLAREDPQWIEAPLVVGRELIGLLSISFSDEGLNAAEWQLIQWTIMGVSFALRSAIHTDAERDRERNNIWRQALLRVAHQLKNRLKPTQSFLNMLERDPRVAANIELLSAANRSIAKAICIVRDFNTYARTDIPVSATLTPVMKLMHTLHADAKDIAVQHGLAATAVTLDLEEELGRININVDVVREVLEILVTNSVRHAQRPPPNEWNVHLSAVRRSPHLYGKCEGEDWICITVTDAGPGIAAENKERIFELRWTTGKKDTGLGLSIAREFVRRMNGEIREEGMEGEGARFAMYFPSHE